MREEQPEDWNPLDADVLADQRKTYDAMRERCPVAHSKFLGWSLFRHQDIAAVLADPQTFSNTSRFPAIPNGMNPPVHGPYNAALAAFFGPEQMTKIEPHVRQIAVSHIMPLLAGGDVDFLENFIIPFTLKSLCAQLGWPEQQWECLAGWVHGNQQVALSGDPAVGKALADLFSEHVRHHLDTHRAALPDRAALLGSSDATTQLLQTKVADKRLTDDEIVSLLRNWAAGHGTVAQGLGIVILHLAQDAELQQRLRQDLALVPAAIEEILRVDGPLVANRRTTTREVEIAGKVIAKDATLTLMWIAANRDPRVFDDADTVKLERQTDAGMVWGQGIHLCIGAPLARLEMRVALEELLALTDNFALADAIPERTVYPGNGFARLPLSFS